MMSPTLSGQYDGGAGGGAHYYCVDASGNQVDPVPGESDANPFHTHIFDGLAKVDVVDSDADYYYSYKTGQWVTCSGGYQGPFINTSTSTDIQYGFFSNHFHCKNGSYPAGSTSENPEAAPQALSPQPNGTTIGASFSTSDIGTKDQFIDKGPWGATAPLGTVACVSANSDKIYFSTSGTCPAASQFPPKPDTTPPVLSSIVGVTSLGSTTITWVTNKPADSVVEHGSSASYGSVTTDAALVTAHSVKLNVGIGYGFTYYFRVKSKDSVGNLATSDSQTILVPIPAIACADSDNGNSVYVKGTATGIYAGAVVGYHAIYGQEPNPTTPKSTPNNYSTYTDHCATSTQLNEGYCSNGQISALGLQCANGCFDGACVASSTGTANSIVTLTQLFPGQYSNTKFSIKVEDTDAIKEFLIKKAGGTTIYGGSPGASGNFGACGGTSAFKSVESSTVTLETADFPLSASVTDCRTGATATSLSVSQPSSTGPGSSSHTLTLSAAAGQVIASTGAKSLSKFRLQNTGSTEAQFTLYCGYSPASGLGYEYKIFNPETGPGPNLPFPAISLVGGAEKEVGYLLNVGGLTTANTFSVSCSATRVGNPSDYKMVTDTVTVVLGGIGTTTTPVPPTPPTTPPTTPSTCAVGTKCPAGSFCQNASSCYYPDGQITCIGWTQNSSGMSSATCPSGTSPCSPTDTYCVAPGQIVPVTANFSKWCAGGSMRYYSGDGKYMTCVNMDDTPPSGYKACGPTDTNCKDRGDKWEGSDPNASRYSCMNSQKCTSSSGGGVCVGKNETCPSGSKYCSSSDQNCIEPDSYKTLVSGVNSYAWCGDGSIDFSSVTQSYCPPAGTGRNISGAQIKAILTKLGSGWGLCEPANIMTGGTKCIEPGQTGPSEGWCAWTPSGIGSMPPMPSSPRPGGTRTCPSLDDTGTVSPPSPPSPVEPEEPRELPECKDGEMSSPMGASSYYLPTCRMPMYRFNLTSQDWEKCESNNKPPYKNAQPYVNVQGNPKAQYTNCTSISHFGLNKEWMTRRYQVHDPRVDGEWYMPPWDSAVDMYQYNTKTDDFEKCSGRQNTSAMMPLYGEYFAPCMPVPEKDRKWLILKARADYKMHQAWNRPKPMPEPIIGLPEKPLPERPLPPVILPVVPPVSPIDTIIGEKCRSYIRGIRQGLAGDKAFYKDVSRQLAQVSKDYADAAAVQSLLQEVSETISSAEAVVRGGKCEGTGLTDLQNKLQKLHTEIFPDLASYMPDIQDFVQYKQCRSGLVSRVAQLKKLGDSARNKEVKKEIEDLRASIEEKMKALDSGEEEDTLDRTFACQEFSSEIEKQIAPLVIAEDVGLNRTIDNIIAKKLEPVIAQLTIQLEDRQKTIEGLYVKLAEVHKALEAVSSTASQISEKIAVSYTALARIEDKFEEQKKQIQEAKESLFPLIEKASMAMKAKRCLAPTYQQMMTDQFGTLASVNWIGGRDDELEKRLAAFITACEAREATAEYVDTFAKNLADLNTQNQSDSYSQGMTAFADVPTHEWYYGAMQTASETGFMTKGAPAENALKQDALLMVLRASGARDSDVTGTCSLKVPGVASVSPYAICAVNYAASKGLKLSGPMTILVTRKEVARWIAALAGLPETGSSTEDLKSYRDLAGLNETELAGVAAVVKNAIMVGEVSTEKSVFKPNDPLTRSALAVVLEKLLHVSGKLPE